MGMINGIDSVRRCRRVLESCQGKVGQELVECVQLTLMGYGRTLGEVPDDVRIWFELAYIGKQLEIQENIHDQVNKSIDTLKELEYPQENIEKILEEFNKPINERNIDVVAENI